MLEETFDAIKNVFPISILALVPVLIIFTPSAVNAAQEFTVYRMQQYDLQSKSYGSRNSMVNMEARVLSSSNSLARKCVVAHARDLTYEKYQDALERAMGALLIIIPENASKTEMENFMSLERGLMTEQTNVPVYFAHSNENLEGLLYDVQRSTSDDVTSAAEALLNSATSIGYQLVTSGGQSKPQLDHSVVNIQGYLPGMGNQLPTIAIVAHYDSYGIAPYLSYGANSDASGVVAVLELARVFSKLYSNSRTHPRYNILFLLSGGGKFNYQGTRRWIDDALDNPATSNEITTKLSSVDVVLCLDSLGGRSGNLHMHVSKPPREGSNSDRMYAQLKKASELMGNRNMSMVHKKIKLSADTLAWEHERFSIRKLPAVTLSSFDSHDGNSRFSVLDQRNTVSDETLVQNIKVVNEAVMRYIYDIQNNADSPISSGEFGVHKEYVSSWLDYLTSQPRPEQDMHEKHPLVSSLESTMQKHLMNVEKVVFRADKTDPELILYDGLMRTMSASVVRSAVFDLYLSMLITGYVSAIYFVVLKFTYLKAFALRISNFRKIKTA